jgi:hypothetical protein
MRRRENDTGQALQSARKHRINPTADPIPVGDQPKNRQGARSHHPGQPARHRRRGHRIRMHLLRCMGPFLAVRPEGANHQWRRNPPGELSIDPVADERLVRVTAWVGAS